MGKATAAIFAAACVAVASAGIGWGVFQGRTRNAGNFDHRRVVVLEAENQRLRSVVETQQKGREQDEDVGRRGGIEKAVEGIRELTFKQPVAYEVLTRADIRRTLERKISEQYSDEEIKNAGLGLAALGLLPRDYPLKQKYLELLGEQVAAFYDQHQHQLFMFEDARLSSAQNRMILAHELTHALQDQNFGLLRMPLEIKTNDDVALASSALIEGDATLVMSQYMLQNLSLGAVGDSLSSAMTQNLRQLQSAPRYLRETLMFPYLRGQEFCAALLGRGGWEAISEAYKKPPSSTAQILHPEKFFAETREEPIRIEWPDMTVNGEKPLADNVLGEFGIRILLSGTSGAALSEEAGSGWRGDRYLVFDQGHALLWKTVWASDEEAARFSAAAAKCFGSSGRLIRGAGNAVILIDASNEKWAQALTEKFVTAKGAGP